MFKDGYPGATGNPLLTSIEEKAGNLGVSWLTVIIIDCEIVETTFPAQESCLGCGGESTESLPLDHQGYSRGVQYMWGILI